MSIDRKNSLLRWLSAPVAGAGGLKPFTPASGSKKLVSFPAFWGFGGFFPLFALRLLRRGASTYILDCLVMTDTTLKIKEKNTLKTGNLRPCVFV